MNTCCTCSVWLLGARQLSPISKAIQSQGFLFAAVMHTDPLPSHSTSGRPSILAGSFYQMTTLMLLIFFLIPIFFFFFSCRCPFTNKLCHNGWIWDSDKCECVVDVQHPNRREGKDEIKNGHFCLLSPGCLCFILVLSHFFIERVIVLISHPWIDLAYDIETHLKINTRMCLSPSHVFCLDVLLPLY